MIKKLCYIIILVLTAQISSGQFLKPLIPSPDFSASLDKIVSSFSNNYYSIQGNLIRSQTDVDTYESLTVLPGAEKSFIYRFHSAEDTTASWQGIMYSGESYKDAARIYRNLFNQVHNTSLNVYNSTLHFKGEMEEPTEALRFNESSLKAVSTNPAYTRFFAEIEMVNLNQEWEVHLNLHNKKDDK
ncbi:MAG: hypothetical protein ABIT07_09950, partial [Ferruginibacter sp.]